MGRRAKDSRLMEAILNPTVRLWLYGIAVAVNWALFVFRVIDNDQQAALNAIFAALFFIAGINTPTASQERAADDTVTE